MKEKESDKKRYNIYIRKEVMLSFQHYCLDINKSLSQMLETLIVVHLAKNKEEKDG